MKQKEYVSTGGVYEDGYQKCATQTTTNMSQNESFEKNGYIFMPALVADPENMYCAPPLDENGKRLTGQMNYIRKDKVNFVPEERQVNGSLARYNVPFYKQLHYLVRKVKSGLRKSLVGWVVGPRWK